MQLKELVRVCVRVPARFVILIIKYIYQKIISPMTPRACIYQPTCSTYMIEAIQRYGLIRGGIKGIFRILRCHPFAKGGYDPVVKDKE